MIKVSIKGKGEKQNTLEVQTLPLFVVVNGETVGQGGRAMEEVVTKGAVARADCYRLLSNTATSPSAHDFAPVEIAGTDDQNRRDSDDRCQCWNRIGILLVGGSS